MTTFVPETRVELKLPTPLHLPGETAIDPPFYRDHHCGFCDSIRTFLCDRECDLGYIGTCQHCGDERLIRFTRTTIEVCA